MKSTRMLPKIAVVGAGNVGATCAFTLMMHDLAGEIALINRTVDKAKGEALDIAHGVPLLNTTKITYGGFECCEGAHIVIITIGAAQKPGETRLKLIQRNTAIFNEAIPQIVKYAPDSILIIVSNPVDVLTYLAIKLSGFPSSRVIGSGTVLDTARLRVEMQKTDPCDFRDMNAYVIGEHGDSEVIPMSIVSIGGLFLEPLGAEYFGGEEKAKEIIAEIGSNVRNAAYEIIRCKGSTYYAVSVCVTKIVESIIKDNRSVLTVSTLLEGEFGISDVCLSLPCIVGKEGVVTRISPSINEKEIEALRASAKSLRKVIDQISTA
ncbi:MAG: L-lactate dehydrogenase [Candidatus Marinimicrobia bacterium]|nr:L-lactate dehydrogenase [Candidatus Neomarinimicrobiota bacterium]